MTTPKVPKPNIPTIPTPDTPPLIKEVKPFDPFAEGTDVIAFKNSNKPIAPVVVKKPSDVETVVGSDVEELTQITKSIDEELVENHGIAKYDIDREVHLRILAQIIGLYVNAGWSVSAGRADGARYIKIVHPTLAVKGLFP